MSNYQRISYREKYHNRWCAENRRAEVQSLAAVSQKRIDRAYTEYLYTGAPEFNFELGIALSNALCLPEIALQQFQFALDFTTRVIDEKLCYQQFRNTVHNFDWNIYVNYQIYTYVRCVLGLSTDTSLLRDAAIHCFRHRFPTKKKISSFDPLEQQWLLQAVHMAMIGQQFDLATEWLALGDVLMQHAPEIRLLTTFMNNELNNRWDDNRQFQDEFDDFFDRCRHFGLDVDGFYSPNTLYQFEMAVLRDKYLIAEDHQINWQRALLSVGE